MKRIDTPRGPVFVRPGAADRAVVYVHGYNKTAEQAIRDHGLAAQFPTDATVIIPEAPRSAEQPVSFPSLSELLAFAGAPGARTMALAHSGGYRTLKSWLASPELREAVLLDAAYGDVTPFASWPGILHVVGKSTAEKSMALARARGVPYHKGQSHDGVVRDEGWIARFVAGSSTLKRRSLLVPLIIAGAAYVVYRSFR